MDVHWGRYGMQADALDTILSSPLPITAESRPPIDIREVSTKEEMDAHIDIQLGAYGVAMASRFNGFGDVETCQVEDPPMLSMFGLAPRTVATPKTETQVALSANPEIHYQVIVSTIDALRKTDEGEELFPDVAFGVAK